MNKCTLTAFAIGVSTVMMSTVVMAQVSPTPEFATVDSDNSGQVSYQELQIVLPNISEQQFKIADKDNSGELDPQEFATLSTDTAGSLVSPTDKGTMSNDMNGSN